MWFILFYTMGILDLATKSKEFLAFLSEHQAKQLRSG